ncbi:hypothetical protein RRF57_001539 [Xylaria bambusicola]|uniref:Uncharacterized protein n=1 Tax=Xylaria bambusicola TaxID=326684 RepID=A0AAN7Z3L8_9PEZI
MIPLNNPRAHISDENIPPIRPKRLPLAAKPQLVIPVLRRHGIRLARVLPHAAPRPNHKRSVPRPSVRRHRHGAPRIHAPQPREQPLVLEFIRRRPQERMDVGIAVPQEGLTKRLQVLRARRRGPCLAWTVRLHVYQDQFLDVFVGV